MIDYIKFLKSAGTTHADDLLDACSWAVEEIKSLRAAIKRRDKMIYGLNCRVIELKRSAVQTTESSDE